MIAQLEGNITFKGGNFIIIDVGGVGYKVFTTLDMLHVVKKNTSVKIWTHLAVRENSMDLYGFNEQPELEFFEMLITISGIGPKSALGILSVAPIETLRKAVSTGDTSYLTKVSGIGKKNAEKIVLELKDKLGSIDGFAGDEMLKEDTDAIEALQALGYSAQEAREALKKTSGKASGVNAKIKEALKHIADK